MSYRDIEDLTLGTIHDKLVEITGIASGLILAKMPDYEFINKIDSSRHSASNADQFPSIGMRYWDMVRYNTNTYGDEILTDSGDGTGARYTPLGEMCFPISIYLFTDTRADQMRIGNLIRAEFSKQLFYPLVDDEIDGEYTQVEFVGFNDVQAHRPYVKVFNIKCHTRDLEMTSGYLVDSIEVGLQAQVNSITANVNAQETFNYFLEIPPETLDPDVDTYFQDWNIIQTDLTDSGEFERTEQV